MAVAVAVEAARVARAVAAASADWVAAKVAKGVTVVVEARAADRVRAAEAAEAARAAVKAARAAAKAVVMRQVQTWACQLPPAAYRAPRRHPHMQPDLHRRASATRQWPMTRP